MGYGKDMRIHEVNIIEATIFTLGFCENRLGEFAIALLTWPVWCYTLFQTHPELGEIGNRTKLGGIFVLYGCLQYETDQSDPVLNSGNGQSTICIYPLVL